MPCMGSRFWIILYVGDMPFMSLWARHLPVGHSACWLLYKLITYANEYDRLRCIIAVIIKQYKRIACVYIFRYKHDGSQL
jgi:hypothetical protein